MGAAAPDQKLMNLLLFEGALNREFEAVLFFLVNSVLISNREVDKVYS